MNPFEYRITADHRRKGDSLDYDGEAVADLQFTFTMLFVNRGRSLWRAAQDAEQYETRPNVFLQRVERLMSLGLVELNGDTIFLPLSPRNLLERLSDL